MGVEPFSITGMKGSALRLVQKAIPALRPPAANLRLVVARPEFDSFVWVSKPLRAKGNKKPGSHLGRLLNLLLIPCAGPAVGTDSLDALGAWMNRWTARRQILNATAEKRAARAAVKTDQEFRG